jgi:hypothetical protein
MAGGAKGRGSVSCRELHLSLISRTALQVELRGKSIKNSPSPAPTLPHPTQPRRPCAFGLRTPLENTLGMGATDHAVISPFRNGLGMCAA